MISRHFGGVLCCEERYYGLLLLGLIYVARHWRHFCGCAPEVVDGVDDKEDEECALQRGHQPEQAAGWGQEEAGGSRDEDADLVHPVAGECECAMGLM